MVLVFDGHGHFEGIVTPMDVLGTIAGGFDETETDEPKFVRRGGVSLLVAGWVPVDEFDEQLRLTSGHKGSAETAAELVMERLVEVPKVGHYVHIDGRRMEIDDIDGSRIDRLIVQRDTAARVLGAPD